MAKKFTKLVTTSLTDAVAVAEIDGQEVPVIVDYGKLRRDLQRSDKVINGAGLIRDLYQDRQIGFFITTQPCGNETTAVCGTGYFAEDGEELPSEADEEAKAEASYRRLENIAAATRGEELSGVDEEARREATKAAVEVAKELCDELPGIYSVAIEKSGKSVDLTITGRTEPQISEEEIQVTATCVGVPVKGKKVFKIITPSGEQITLTESISPIYLEISYFFQTELVIYGNPFVDENGEYKKVKPTKVAPPEHLKTWYEKLERHFNEARDEAFSLQMNSGPSSLAGHKS